MPSPTDVTRILKKGEQADDEAMAFLSSTIYGELRVLAARCMRREREDHTLQPTALVHEAYMRLVNQNEVGDKTRGHFKALAALQMRRILVDHARARERLKRRGHREQVSNLDLEAGSVVPSIDLLALHEALVAFSAFDPRRAQVVELRYFAGMTMSEIAEHLDLSRRTVQRDWDVARCWLYAELRDKDSQSGSEFAG